MAIGKELNLKNLISQSICYLGRAALFEGNYRASLTSLRGKLSSHGKREDRRSRWAESLEGLGGCKVLSGNYQQAVRFFGAAEVMREEPFFRCHYLKGQYMSGLSTCAATRWTK